MATIALVCVLTIDVCPAGTREPNDEVWREIR